MNYPASIFSRLTEFCQLKMTEYRTPGLQIAITDREQEIFQANLGLADRETGQPLTSENLFQIASLGKTITSTLVLQQGERGRLDLHAPISNYLPWFKVKTNFPPITTHHLLTHTAGIIGDANLTPSSLYEVVALTQTETATAPGERFHYSNVGYQTLGYLLQEITGRTYPELIQTEICAPLNLQRMFSPVTFDLRAQMAVGYEALYDDRPNYQNMPLERGIWSEYGQSDGRGIITTASEQAVFLRMLLNEGQGTRSRLLTKESFKMMTTPSTKTTWPDNYYGYGVMLSEIAGHKHLGHGGLMQGFRASMLGDLQEGLGVIVLSNGPSVTYEIACFALELLRAHHDNRPLPAPTPRIDPFVIANPTDYTGVYELATVAETTKDLITFKPKDNQLIMLHAGQEISLEKQGDDLFYADHPAFALYQWRFIREDEKVRGAYHGESYYQRETFKAASPQTYDIPNAWKSYRGHYRAAYQAGISNFRAIIRQNELLISFPWGEEATLVELAPAEFRLGKDPAIAERISFDTTINGQTQRANLNGAYYYRTFNS